MRYWKRRVFGNIEPELAWFLSAMTGGQRVIDVGANIGTYSYAAIRRGLVVEAFEPLPDCQRALCAYRHPRLRVHRVALSDMPGTLPLTIPNYGGQFEGGLATLDGKHWQGRETRTIDVEVRTLDSYAFTDVGGIKIDVEGFEPAVLRGAVETVRANRRPVVLTELVHHWIDLTATFRLIEGMGYRGHFLDADLRERPVSEYRPEMNDSGRHINTFLWRPHQSVP